MSSWHKDIGDPIYKLRKFVKLRTLFWDVFFSKKQFVRSALSVYYAIHKKRSNDILYKIYKKRQSNFLPFLAGILAGLAQPPVYAFIFLPIAFIICIRLLDFAEDIKQYLRVGFLFSFGYSCIAFYWPAYGTFIFGYPAWTLPFFALGIILLASLFPTLAITAFGIIGNKIPPYRRILLFSSLWLLAEYYRGFKVFHFPFGFIGYSLGLSEFLYQHVSMFGVLGASFFLVLWSCTFYVVLFTEDKLVFIHYFRGFIIINLIFIMLCLFGIARLHSNKTEYTPYRAGIIQGNTSVRDTPTQSFLKHAHLTRNFQNSTGKKLDIIIWPEGASMPFDVSDKKNFDYFKNFILPNQTFIFNGIRLVNQKKGEDIYNTMYIYENDVMQFHDKHYLVPYGEYLPILQKYKFGKAMARGAGIGFSAGKEIHSIKTKHGILLPLICYEITYSGKIMDWKFWSKKKPDYIVNITNDEWFGISSGPFQHLVASQFRAVEEGLPVVRASNNGFSGVIDPMGRVVSKKTELFQEDFVASFIPQKIAEGTFFSLWGNWPIIIISYIFVYYYVFMYLYHKKQKEIHAYVSQYIENVDKKKQDPNFKRRF